MGYYTRFDIEIRDESKNLVGDRITNEVFAYAEEIVGFDLKEFLFDDIEIRDESKNLVGDRITNEEIVGFDLKQFLFDEIKWYSYERDILKISEKFPEYYICVRGDGEETDDLWKQVYKGGKNIAYWSLSNSEPSFNNMLFAKNL